MSESELTNKLFFLPSRKDESVTHIAQETLSPEAMLVKRICEGNQEDFDLLYKKFSPMVNGIILSRVPADDVSDLVQEVFLTAYQKINSLRNPNTIGAWLATIARNTANDFYRKSKPIVEIPEDLPEQKNYRHEAREILDIIRGLPDTYRETLVLRLVEGMSGNEIAEQTGLTPESVRINLHRGMKLLREKIGVNS